MNPKRILSLAAVLVLAACATPVPSRVQLTAPNGDIYAGWLDNERDWITVDIGTDRYQGRLITSGGMHGQVHTYGGIGVGSGRWGMWGGIGPTYIDTADTQGKAVLHGDDGGTLECDFQLDGRHALGHCLDLKGKRYVLEILSGRAGD